MKKVLVFGSAGMLGHVVYQHLLSLNKYELLNTSFPEKVRQDSYILDATNKLEVEKYIREIKPDVLINCVGILIMGSQQNPSNAIYLNSFLPHHLASVLSEFNGKLIHISTDCVFSGERGDYNESDFKDARDTYGLSKALGEVDYDNHLTLRTSIIGPELKERGEGLMHWFFNQKGDINGFEKAFWSGVTTLQLAKNISFALDNDIKGLYHVTNNSKISKYDLLKLIKETWHLEQIQINQVEGKKVDKSFIDNRKLTGMEVPTYKQMLVELFNFMQQNSAFYKHYNIDI